MDRGEVRNCARTDGRRSAELWPSHKDKQGGINKGKQEDVVRFDDRGQRVFGQIDESVYSTYSSRKSISTQRLIMNSVHS
jgi:hypothetical protein